MHDICLPFVCQFYGERKAWQYYLCAMCSSASSSRGLACNVQCNVLFLRRIWTQKTWTSGHVILVLLQRPPMSWACGSTQPRHTQRWVLDAYFAYHTQRHTIVSQLLDQLTHKTQKTTAPKHPHSILPHLFHTSTSIIGTIRKVSDHRQLTRLVTLPTNQFRYLDRIQRPDILVVHGN